jgi:multidrug efflux system outer membrane protein
MASASDLTGAENTFAQHKLTVLQGEASVEQSWDTLRGILHLPRDQWTRPILPTDRPHLAPAEPPSPEQALEAAIRHRPEVALLGLDLKSSELALRKAENDALPRIDLGVTGSITGSGDSYGGALRDLSGHTTRDFSVMATLTWTPLGRANRVNREMARIEHDVTVANREVRVQEIWNEVRAAVRRQRNAALQVTAALQSLTLANQSLEIENRKYVAGSSSNLAIAQLQNGLASAEVAELSALLENESAQAALLLATGQLLEKRHIQLEVDQQP